MFLKIRGLQHGHIQPVNFNEPVFTNEVVARTLMSALREGVRIGLACIKGT